MVVKRLLFEERIKVVVPNIGLIMTDFVGDLVKILCQQQRGVLERDFLILKVLIREVLNICSHEQVFFIHSKRLAESGDEKLFRWLLTVLRIAWPVFWKL